MFFFFNDTATTEIYTLSLHDALPICGAHGLGGMPRTPAGGPTSGSIPRDAQAQRLGGGAGAESLRTTRDRKSTRLNSSHVRISDAVLCLKQTMEQTLPVNRTDAPDSQ